MVWLYCANALVLLIAVWAVWERRATFGSRWDAPFTWGIVIFSSATALDSPWSAVAAASFPLTGKYYLLNALGQILFLVGAATGIKGIYMRLMTDDDFARFMRRRIAPLVLFPATGMMVCVLASPATSTMPAQHLYLVEPDGWLFAYWVFLVGGLVTLETISTYGMLQLRRESDAVGVNAQIAFVVVAAVATVVFAAGVIAGRVAAPAIVIWSASYLSIGGGAIGAVLMWRHRVAELTRPARRGPANGIEPG